MKKYLLILSAILALTACGKQDYTVEDKSLRPMVEEFFNDCFQYGNKDEKWLCSNPGELTIKSVEVLPVKSQEGLSRCNGSKVRQFEKCTVIISNKRTKNKDLRKVVVYHELGHAVLGRGHVTGEDNCDQIMFTHGESCISKSNWKGSVKKFWSR